MYALLQDYLVIDSVGLALDILGALLLAVFGLPNARALDALLHRGHHVRITVQGNEAGAATVVRRHQFWGRAGLLLLIVGFGLQLLSNGMQRHWLGLTWW